MTITVVTGPPCVGKSHYIRQHAQPADIVIDLDRLALALAAEGTASHDYPEHVRTVARRARIAAIDAAIAQHMRGRTVWIIDANPSRQQRAWYHRRAATFVNLSEPTDVLAARARERPAANRALIAAPMPEIHI